MKKQIFTSKFLALIGFILIHETKSKYDCYSVYGQAKDKIGMTIISWNDEGLSCDYYGNLLNPNTTITIEKDGGTRTVFSGYVYTQEDVQKILSLTL